MTKIKHIASGINVAPLLWALQANPQLWNENTTRTESANSPHHGLSDIWVRYGKEGQDPKAPHESMWYPSSELLNIKPMVYELFGAVAGGQLGGVLITKIPAGMECKPHSDNGWHADFYEKFAIQIASAPNQKFCFDGEELETKPGDVFWFNNSYTHWVTNPTEYDRITLIICLRK